MRLVVREDPETHVKRIKDIREQEVFFCELPLMTDRNTFIINGAERVIVSQLHRSPGVSFDEDDGKAHTSGRKLYTARVIPYRGSWLEFEFDRAQRPGLRPHRPPQAQDPGQPHAALPGLRLRRQDPGPVLRERGPAGRRQTSRAHHGHRGDRPPHGRSAGPRQRGSEQGTGAQAGEGQGQEGRSHHHPQAGCSTPACAGPSKRTRCAARKKALLEALYRKLRPGDPPTLESARNLWDNLFFNTRRYDLAKVGRHKLNKKLKLDQPLTTRVLTKDDLVKTVQYLLRLNAGKGDKDDIDHLGNRRVRSAGELLENQFRLGLVRIEKAVKERMSILDMDEAMPSNLINAKPVTAGVREFFGSSQLSQFMDQTNPLAALTHNRRLSALGPGGLNRERAGFEVRDVHHTHYAACLLH